MVCRRTHRHSGFIHGCERCGRDVGQRTFGDGANPAPQRGEWTRTQRVGVMGIVGMAALAPVPAAVRAQQMLPSGPTKVLVVDDHRTFAELLSGALEAELDITCVGHAQNSEDAFELVARLRPDVVLMDVRLPDRDGILTAGRLVAKDPNLKILILTAHATLTDIDRAASAGACGFLAKDGALVDVLSGIRTARRGSLILSDGLRARLSAFGQHEPALSQWRLTARELDVLRLLGMGRDPRAISKELGVSLHTCRGHVKSVLGKMGVHSQLEAVVLATRSGVIRLGD
ncbi:MULTISPECIES: response regulator [unclassified Knoellia]|uniref:response regulator n=1 Tax=Knoellia altitudinis TaxID=3404795 RepID=UPI0036137B2B